MRKHWISIGNIFLIEMITGPFKNQFLIISHDMHSKLIILIFFNKVKIV